MLQGHGTILLLQPLPSMCGHRDPDSINTGGDVASAVKIFETRRIAP